VAAANKLNIDMTGLVIVRGLVKQNRVIEQQRLFGMAMPMGDHRTAMHDEAELRGAYNAIAANNFKGGSTLRRRCS
jgi:hypothetical protein